MSLLLDALKKAEKAKDDAKRRAQSPDSVPDEDATLTHVRTRNELPDISRPLELYSEDIPGSKKPEASGSPVPDAFQESPAGRPSTSGPIELALAADTDQATSPTTSPATSQRKPSARAAEPATDPQATQRAAARNVFEAKFREPNPKMPFYITMAALGLFTVGTVIYFWYQLRPPPALVNTNAKPPPDEKKVDVADSRPSAANQPAQPAPAATPAIPGLPAQSASPIPAPAPPPAASPPIQPIAAAPASAPRPTGTQETPAASKPRAPRQVVPQGRPTPPDPSKLSVSRAGPEVNPKVETAWLAYNQGDLLTARSNYQEALREEASNRDALLGMAALEVRANRPELAVAYYQKVLEANPRDPHAQAGLLALRARTTDPIQGESRVKSLLASDPEAHVLYFTLGNQLAQQGRWPEAQQAYFKAFSADPENPDFAYNLAVSLDQVRQPKQALEYYRRAISLAQQRASSFDQALARNRVQELTR